MEETRGIAVWGAGEVYTAEAKHSFSNTQNMQLSWTSIQQENTAEHHEAAVQSLRMHFIKRTHIYSPSAAKWARVWIKWTICPSVFQNQILWTNTEKKT